MCLLFFHHHNTNKTSNSHASWRESGEQKKVHNWNVNSQLPPTVLTIMQALPVVRLEKHQSNTCEATKIHGSASTNSFVYYCTKNHLKEIKINLTFDLLLSHAAIMRCECNGRSQYCLHDALGLHCVDCQGNTEGRNCERCKDGFYLQGAGQSCSPCHCNPTGECKSHKTLMCGKC